LLKSKDDVEDEIINDQKVGDDKIYSDDENDGTMDEIVDNIEQDIEDIEDVLVSIADIVGTLFKTHQQLTLNIVDELLQTLLPKYFAETSTNFEKKMALFIIDDMVQYLGQDLLLNIWDNCANILIKYTDHPSTELRQASCYGIGEFAKSTKTGFSNYALGFISAISRALEINDDGESKDRWANARDNAVAAIGKIISHQHAHIDINIWVPKWVSYLPLKHDKNEQEIQHSLLCDFLLNNSALVSGEDNCNLPRIIRILGYAFENKYSSKELNEKVKNIFTAFKNNSTLLPFVAKAIEGADEKIKNKLKKVFS